jgi:hypothetical protein
VQMHVSGHPARAGATLVQSRLDRTASGAVHSKAQCHVDSSRRMTFRYVPVYVYTRLALSRCKLSGVFAKVQQVTAAGAAPMLMTLKPPPQCGVS